MTKMHGHSATAFISDHDGRPDILYLVHESNPVNLIHPNPFIPLSDLLLPWRGKRKRKQLANLLKNIGDLSTEKVSVLAM